MAKTEKGHGNGIYITNEQWLYALIIACLHFHHIIGLFEGPAFIQPIRGILKAFKPIFIQPIGWISKVWRKADSPKKPLFGPVNKALTEFKNFSLAGNRYSEFFFFHEVNVFNVSFYLSSVSYQQFSLCLYCFSSLRSVRCNTS